MRTGTKALVLTWLLCTAPFLVLVAQQPGSPHPARLADFAWLAGHWRGTMLGAERFVAEQTCSDAQGGVIHGMFRVYDPAANRTLILEYFTLRETAEGIEMRSRQFDTALASRGSDAVTVLRLKRAEGSRFVFENPVHARPKNSVLTRTGTDSYTSRSEVVSDSGASSLIDMTWKRAAPPAGAEQKP